MQTMAYARLTLYIPYPLSSHIELFVRPTFIFVPYKAIIVHVLDVSSPIKVTRVIAMNIHCTLIAGFEIEC